MPESIPAVEHIKHAKKRLKEFAHMSETKIPRPQILNNYDLPGDVDSIQTLITIIREHPGDQSIKIGENYYSV
jgi:hypothetical protein